MTDRARALFEEALAALGDDASQNMQDLIDAWLPHLRITDGVTAPTAEVGVGLIYIDTADGSLKVRFGDGTTKTLATNP